MTTDQPIRTPVRFPSQLIGFRAVGRGTQSGVLTDQRGFTLYTFRGGRVARHEFFVDRDQAERAAGLG